MRWIMRNYGYCVCQNNASDNITRKYVCVSQCSFKSEECLSLKKKKKKKKKIYTFYARIQIASGLVRER